MDVPFPHPLQQQRRRAVAPERHRVPAAQADEPMFMRRRIEAVIGQAVELVVLLDEQQLHEAVNSVLEVFPDVDIDSVRRLCARFNAADVMQYLAEAPPADIPRRELPRVARQIPNLVDDDEEEGSDDEDGEGAVAAAPPPHLDKNEAYQRLSRFFAAEGARANNKTTFRGKQRVCMNDITKNDKFKERVLTHLFPELSITTIRPSLAAFDGNISPAYAALYAIANEIETNDYGGWRPEKALRGKLKKPRTGGLRELQNDPHFTKALKDEIDAIIRIRDGTVDEDEEEKSECPVCFDSFPVTQMLACSVAQEVGDEAGEVHRFCVECIRQVAEQVALGEAVLAGPFGLPCMDPTCHRILVWNEVRMKLPKQLRKRLSRRFQEANIAAAGLNSIERCKECGFAVEMEVPTDVNKVFSCRKCGAEYCRLCEQKWDNAHFGRKCNELEAYYLIQYREKMTAAVTRKCPRCGVVFQKDGGCNLMTCSSCGMRMCFLCRKENITYAHFCPHVRDPNHPGCPENCPLKCLLYADSNAAIDHELNRIKEEARQDNRIANHVSPNRREAQVTPRSR